MCDEAQILLKDAKAKVEYIRLEIKRLESDLLNPQANRSLQEKDASKGQAIWPAEQTIQQLEHHLTIETTMIKGGENAVKVLKQTGAKKELVAEAHQSLFESKQRIALLEESLRRKYKQSNANQQSASIYNDTLLKPAAVTGKLQVRSVRSFTSDQPTNDSCLFLSLSRRLLGCQDLFEDALLPAVAKRDSFGSSPDAKYRTLRTKNELSSTFSIDRHTSSLTCADENENENESSEERHERKGGDDQIQMGFVVRSSLSLVS